MFVDKTIFIKKVIMSSHVFLQITRPRRWGKSLNLDMVKTFLEPSIDENGNISNTKNKAIFEGGSYAGNNNQITQLKPLKIAQLKHEQFYQNTLGKFPVISLNLINEAERDCNYDTFRYSIRNTFMKQEELYKFMLIDEINYHNSTENPSDKVMCDITDVDSLEETVFDKIRCTRDDLNTFRKYWRGDCDIEINDAIPFLLKILQEYFKKTVYVLIDEYDAVLNKYLGTPMYNTSFSKLRGFLRCLKDNPGVEKVVMVGITPICFGYIAFFTDSVSTGYFSEYFGFTTEEVKDLVLKTVRGNQEKASKIENQLRSWYNGYQILDLTIYNPWSIMCCLEKYFSYPVMDPFKTYWASSGSLNLIQQIIKKVAFSKEIKTLFTIGEYHSIIIKCDYCNFLFTDSSANIVNDFCKLLFHTGYLTLKSADIYQIPNKEIIICYSEGLLPIWIQAKFEHGSEMTNLINELAVSIEDKAEYFDCIENGFLDKLTAKDKSSKIENDFQDIMAAPARIFQIVSGKAKHLILSETSTQSQMRANHVFFPIKSQSETGIIHEYTQTDTLLKKNTLLIETLWQIFAKLYLEPLVNDIQADELAGIIKKIIVRGIVFYSSSNWSGWAIDYIECKMDVDSARALIEIFSSSPYKNKLANQSITEKERIKSRKEFLEANSCESFYQFLARCSVMHVDQLAKLKNIEKESEKMIKEKEIMQKEKEWMAKGKEKIIKYCKSEAQRKPAIRKSAKPLKRFRKKIFEEKYYE